MQWMPQSIRFRPLVTGLMEKPYIGVLLLIKNQIKSLNQLAVPLIANSLFGLSIECIDQAMVGHLSISAFAAIGAVGNFLYTLAGIIDSIAIAFNIYGSQAIGERRNDKFLALFRSSLLLDFFLGAGFGLFLLLFRGSLLRQLYGFSGQTLHEANTYLSIMSGYPLLQLIIFTLTNCLKIKKNTKWILIISTTTTLLHTGLNYLLIFGKLGFPELGIAGAAISSMLILCLDAGCYAWLLRKEIWAALPARRSKLIFLIQKSLPLLGQELIEGGLFVIALQALLAHLGTIVLSSYLLIGQFLQIGLIPAFMYSSALLTLVGESQGARHSTRLKTLPRLASALALTFFSLSGILFSILWSPFAGLITSNLRLIHYSAGIFLLLWLANSFQPLFTIYKAALQSVGQSTYVFLTTFLVNLAALILMILITIDMHLGIYGIAFCLFGNYSALFAILLLSYSKAVKRSGITAPS